MPSTCPYAAAIFALCLLDRQANRAVERIDGLAAIHCGTFSGPTGLTACVSTVWNPETRLAENLENGDTVFRLLDEPFDRKALEDERSRYAQGYAPIWIGPHSTRSAPFVKNWGVNRFRYGRHFELESQYRTIWRDCLWLGSHAVKKTTQTFFTDERKTRTILEPNERPNREDD